jgi:sugar phosphate isomerase/epimerase
LPYVEEFPNQTAVQSWQDRIHGNLEKIMSAAVPKDKIAIETLDYSFELVDDIIVDLDLKICMDLGHLMVHGFDIKKVFKKYAYRTSIIHLHGIENEHDHLTLERLPINLIEPVLWILKRFSGVVSLEIFSFENLNSSLKFLEHHWDNN